MLAAVDPCFLGVISFPPDVLGVVGGSVVLFFPGVIPGAVLVGGALAVCEDLVGGDLCWEGNAYFCRLLLTRLP